MGIRFIFQDFFAFLKKPHTKPYSGHFSPGDTIRLSLLLAACLLVIRLVGIIIEVNGFRPLVLYFSGHELARQQIDSSIASLLLGALVMAPLLEEAAYRWGLRFGPVRTSVSLGLIVFYWLPYGGTYSTTILRVLDQPGFYLMVAMALVTGLTTYAILSISYLKERIGRAWERNFRVVFYTSALLFGLMHIFNVRDMSWTIVTLAPLITFQQIVLGLFNGYVRMRYGIWQAVVQHALFNVLPVAIQLSDRVL